MIKTLLIISGIFILCIVLPMMVYFIVLAGTTGFYRGKRMVKDDQNEQEG